MGGLLGDEMARGKIFEKDKHIDAVSYKCNIYLQKLDNSNKYTPIDLHKPCSLIVIMHSVPGIPVYLY